MEVRRTLITDRRSVTIDVADAPEHRTPGGRTPIAPRILVIEMWVSPWTPNNLTTWVTISGPRTEDPKRGQRLTRRLPVDEAPQWARELAEQHRPAWAPPEPRP